MALFTAPGPNGETLQIDAPDEASAAAAIQEMAGSGGRNTMQGGGMFDDLPTREEARGARAPAPAPQGQPQSQAEGGMFGDVGISRHDQFSGAFDPSQDSAPTAEGLDQRLNGEADEVGRGYHLFNSALMGGYDEIIGLVEGGVEFAKGGNFSDGYARGTGKVRDSIARYEQRHPAESMALGVAAALPTAMIPGAAAVRGGSLGAKVTRGAAAGAGYGAAQGYGEGEGGVENRVKSAAVGGAVGAGIGGAVPVIGAGVGRIAGKRAGKAAIPSVDQLDDAATVLYQRADNAGIAVQPRALQRLTTILPQRMRNMDFDPDLHPKTAIAMRRLEEMQQRGASPAGGAHTVFSLGEVEAMRRKIRQAISTASGPGDKADRAMAYKLLDQYDMWMNGLKPADMLAGGSVSGREAIQIVQEARGLWARKSKGDVLADIVEAAQLDDDVAAGIRRGFKSLAKSKGRLAPFTEGEKAAIRKVARGGDMGWITRSLGMLSPTTVGGTARGAAVAGLGVLSGNPAAMVAPVVGYGAKKVGNAAIKRAAGQADAVVRAGGAVPIDAKAAKTAGDYATRLIGAAGQAGIPRPGIEVMFPNDSPTYR